MISTMPVAMMTLRGLLDRRRTWVLVLLAAVPVVTALLVAVFADQALDEQIFSDMVVLIVLPLIALVFGTGALGGELDDGTIVYLLTTPIRRGRIVFTKSAVAATLTAALVVPATLLTGLIISIDAAGVGAPTIMDATVTYAVAVAAGGTAYVVGFLALSSFTSRALAIGLAYVLIWEGILTDLFEALRVLSVREATLGLVGAIDGSSAGSTLGGTASVMTLGAIIVIGLLLGSWRLSRYQVRGGD